MGKTSIALAGLLFLAVGGFAQTIPAQASISQATNMVSQDAFMSPARMADFWNDIGIPYVLANGLGGGISLTQATNVALPLATNVFNGLAVAVTNNFLPTVTNLNAKIQSLTNLTIYGSVAATNWQTVSSSGELFTNVSGGSVLVQNGSITANSNVTANNFILKSNAAPTITAYTNGLGSSGSATLYSGSDLYNTLNVVASGTGFAISNCWSVTFGQPLTTTNYCVRFITMPTDVSSNNLNYSYYLFNAPSDQCGTTGYTVQCGAALSSSHSFRVAEKVELLPQ